MTNLQVYQLCIALNQMSFKNIQNGVFSYAFMRNKEKLNKRMKWIQDSVESMKSEELKDLDKQLKPLVDKAIQAYATELKVNSITEAEGQAIQQQVLSEWGHCHRYAELMRVHLENSKPFENEESDFKPYEIKSYLIQSLPFDTEQIQVLWPLIKHVKDTDAPTDAAGEVSE